MTRSSLLSLIFATALSTACGSENAQPDTVADGITLAGAAELGVDTTRLAALVEPRRRGKFGKQKSLLVMKDGRLILEEYFDGARRDRRHGVQSVSQSITSLLVGYAIAQGYIASIDDPIAKYLPKYRNLLTGGKEKVTIRHLLSMQSGLEWNEHQPGYDAPGNMRAKERASADGIAFVLSQPLATQPGETTNYNGGGMTILAEILRTTSGLSPEEILARAFEGMLDSTEIQPSYQQDGRWNAAGGFYVTPRGMLKIGQMVLQRGKWNGKKLFDAAWIEESTGAVDSFGGAGYGYLWWRYRVIVDGHYLGVIEAQGYGGQRITIVPAINVVMVTTAEDFNGGEASVELLDRVLAATGPFDVSRAPPLSAQQKIDPSYANPPGRVEWAKVLDDADRSGSGIRLWLDTLSARRLDDGSYLVWMRSEFEKPVVNAGRSFDRLSSRFVLRCETPTDGRTRRVATTGFLRDSAVFQDVVGLEVARSRPWSAAWARSADLAVNHRTCALLTSRRR